MKGQAISYTLEELDFIRSVCKWQRAEAHAAFCQKFRRDDVSLTNFNALCKRKGWLTGRTGCFAKGQEPHNKGKSHPARGRAAETQFKKGNLPHNTRYLGHERVSKEGYVEISVAETNRHTGFHRRYVLKHVWLWEKLNGPIPAGHCLKCLSDDKANTDPSNWECIPRALLPRLVGGNRYTDRVAYDAAPPELKPTIMAVAKLEHRARLAKSTNPTKESDR